MTDLKCSVCGCTYNQQSKCCRGEISIGDKNARSVEDTKCESFECNCGDADCTCGCNATNAVIHKEPEGKLVIRCEATNCIHNDNNYCSAQSVDIGDSSADSSKETKCETFKAV